MRKVFILDEHVDSYAIRASRFTMSRILERKKLLEEQLTKAGLPGKTISIRAALDDLLKSLVATESKT